MDSTEATYPLPQATRSTNLLYRCACGTEFSVAPELGGLCPECQRFVRPEALRSALNATVSITGLDEEVPQLSHFDLRDSSSEDLLNSTYGHFQLDRKLGSGGMGAVYRALDTSLQRYVAVKVMRQADKSVDSRIALMLREAVAQARLNHPNVVTIYYVGREGEEPFLAMELLAGPTLAERLRTDKTIPYADAIRYGIQVASALQHAAQFGVIHGDIKPANLLLTSDNNVKLSDFGLSSNPGTGQRSETVSGTPAYFAPELLDHPNSIQSDMYALGVTLFELVFGQTPFRLQGSTVRERLQSHLTATIDFPQAWPNDIPREFGYLITRLLAKHPADRYETYEDLLEDLHSIEPVSTTDAGMAPRVMAYFVDQLLLLVCLAPFAVTIWLMSDKAFKSYTWMVPIIAFISLIVPAIYLIITYHGWRSLGRYLFQLRIVDQNGLAPRPQQLVTREVLRNAVSWIGPLAIYVTLFYEGVGFWPLGVVGPFVLADALFVISRKDRKSLHDYLSRSQVVLATNKHYSHPSH